MSIQSLTIEIMENKLSSTVKDNRAVSSKSRAEYPNTQRGSMLAGDGGLMPTMSQEVCRALCGNQGTLVRAAVRILADRKRCRDVE